MAKRLQLSNNFCSRRVCTPEDRISQLPDDILVHILSFLSVKEAADTSVLSKRWLPLWRYVHRLDFAATKPLHEVALDEKLRKRHMKKYVRWVNRTLQMCKAQRLDQFRVCFDLNKFAQNDIDKWLEFAFSRQVQRLELELLKGGKWIRDCDYCYTFPPQLFGLNQPHLNNLREFPPLQHNFKSVKVLLLKCVNVTGEVLEFFLQNCPYLEEMVVYAAATLVNLDVVGPSLKLKHLGIWSCPDLKSLKIRDTNLVTLGTTSGHILSLSNVPMLIEVDIISFSSTLDNVLAGVSCVFSQLEVLKITANMGLKYMGHYKFPELTKLKKFVVCVRAWEDMSVLGWKHVIEAAPLLEEFELKVVDRRADLSFNLHLSRETKSELSLLFHLNSLTAALKLVRYGGVTPELNSGSGISLLKWGEPTRSERKCRKAERCPLHHLKVLKLSGYYGRTSEVELVRYFLENAIALQKIIVDPRPQHVCYVSFTLDKSKEEQMARNLAKLQLEGQVPSHIELLVL